MSSASESLESQVPTLDTPVGKLAGIGTRTASQLRGRGLETLRDLLEYLPRTYQFEAEERPIAGLQPGQIHTVRGEIVAADIVGGRGRGRFEATLDDGSDQISLCWFNAPWMRSKLTPGMKVRVRGKVGAFRSMLQMVNPTFQTVDDETPTIDESKFRPIYPAGAELSSKAIETAIHGHLETATAQLQEWFDDDVLTRRRLMPRTQAYAAIHRPRNYADAVNAHRRLVYDELMLLQLGLGLARRAAAAGRLGAPVVRLDKLLDDRIRARFPFQLTGAQERAAFDIIRDMKTGLPMNRLLQGDVGSGKTAVALYAMLVCVANKLQAAILAPTEVLAEQHALSLSRFLAGSGVKVGLFTQRTKKKNDALRESLAAGEIQLAVGTQALIQGDVDFANLGLVVIDEQHRFGVRQRATLRGKGLSPHYLVMTATPIPRTLALSFFADFDVSTIDELPPGRQQIETKHLRRDMADRAYDLVKKEVAKGRQAYVVLPRIDAASEAEEVDVASLEKTFEQLRAGPLKGLRLTMLHGRMKSDEKQAVMNAFREREFDVLCATTVIEVGVDVPNATVMVIDSAEQFGLAQLHQLRGRVGRGADKSYCILLSDAGNEDALERLTVMTKTNDGFELAEADLKMRGPGDFFGIRQSGLPQLKVADLTQELDMLKLCRDDATELLDRDPDLRSPRHADLRRIAAPLWRTTRLGADRVIGRHSVNTCCARLKVRAPSNQSLEQGRQR
ncbi:MAG: ATP-dependent DNA helicase RecG [Tepidisphaeraceae bacterium]